MTRVFALFDHIFDLNAISPELVYKMLSKTKVALETLTQFFCKQ